MPPLSLLSMQGAFDLEAVEGSLAQVGALLDRFVLLGCLHNLAYHAVCTPTQLGIMYARSWPWMSAPTSITHVVMQRRQEAAEQRHQPAHTPPSQLLPR